MIPRIAEPRGVAARTAIVRQRVEHDAQRHRHAFADRDRFGRAQGRQLFQHAAAGFRHGGRQILAVLAVGDAHREDGVALRQDVGRQLRRALRDEAERDAVFTAFERDARDGALGRLEAQLLVARRVAVRLFADQQDRNRAVAPQREVEGEAAQHRHHDVENFGRNARGVEDGDRLALHRHAEHARQQARHLVPHHQAREHEGIAPVGLQRVEAVLDAHVGRQLQRPLVLAHQVVDDAGHVGQAIGHRRVDGDGEFLAAGQLLLRLDDDVVQDRGVDFRRAARFADDQLLHLVEVQQPVRQLEIGRADHVRQLAERRAILVVRIEDEDVAMLMLAEDAAHDRGERAGLARTSGAEHGEMLAQQIVGEDVGGD